MNRPLDSSAGASAAFTSRYHPACFALPLPLKFLEIHSCPGLKRLEGLRCPSLAVARVTACRELTSFKLEEASVLSHLDLSGCVRLEPWELSAACGASLADLRVGAKAGSRHTSVYIKTRSSVSVYFLLLSLLSSFVPISIGSSEGNEKQAGLM